MKSTALASGLIIASLWFKQVTVSAQWSIVGPPPWTSTSLQSTGGITYFLHSATLLACHSIETGPVSRSNTNLSVTVAEMLWNGPCVLCYDCYHTQTTATVLGSLAPGAYRLHLFSYPFLDPFDPSPFPPSASLWQVRDFQVAATAEATLEFQRTGNELCLRFRGVPAASYILERSTDLRNWTSLRTNLGGPGSFTNVVASADAEFFRVRVVSGTITFP